MAILYVFSTFVSGDIKGFNGKVSRGFLSFAAVEKIYVCDPRYCIGIDLRLLWMLKCLMELR